MAPENKDSSAFERERQSRRVGLAGELWGFLRHNKKWWLMPILLVLLMFGLLIILGGTGAAPFIYTLF